MRISIPVKDIVLTTIYFKGTEQARKEAQSIADGYFATKGAVLHWIRKVEKGELFVNGRR